MRSLFRQGRGKSRGAWQGIKQRRTALYTDRPLGELLGHTLHRGAILFSPPPLQGGDREGVLLHSLRRFFPFMASFSSPVLFNLFAWK
jgi:hypothetical protein